MKSLNRDEYYNKFHEILSMLLDMCSNSSIATDKSIQSAQELYKKAVTELYVAYNKEEYDNILYSNSTTEFAGTALGICIRARWDAFKILAVTAGPKYYESIRSYDDQIRPILVDLNKKWHDAIIQEFRAKYGKEEKECIVS